MGEADGWGIGDVLRCLWNVFTLLSSSLAAVLHAILVHET